MFKRRESDNSTPVLSDAFMEFVSHLDPRERELVSARRAESVQEFCRSRSSN